MAILLIPIAKGGASVSVDTSAIPEDMDAIIFAEGLKVILNARMSKVGAVTKLTGEEKTKAQANAMEIAGANLANLMAGELKPKKSATKTGESREVMTEALRLAKGVVKNQIKAMGKKISEVEPKDITEIAKEILAAENSADPTSLVSQAKTNLAARNAIKPALDISGLIEVSPKLVAKNEAAKAKKASEAAAKKAAKGETGKALKASLAIAKKPAPAIHTNH